MLVEAQHRFTVADYHRMGETGVLKPGTRVELLDGRMIDMSPIGPLHGGSVNRLIRLFSRLSAGRWLVSAQNPVYLDESSQPQPDSSPIPPVRGSKFQVQGSAFKLPCSVLDVGCCLVPAPPEEMSRNRRLPVAQNGARIAY
jgi:hypothetical protein